MSKQYKGRLICIGLSKRIKDFFVNFAHSTDVSRDPMTVRLTLTGSVKVEFLRMIFAKISPVAFKLDKQKHASCRTIAFQGKNSPNNSLRESTV